jgi:putative chitinase
MVGFNRDIYFDKVSQKPFNGKLAQEQVDGQNFILTAWEDHPPADDLRHLAYCLATTMHETASTMQPIEEYGKGEGHDYGKKDPVTGQTYYGRGFVQLTWRENYAKATDKLDLDGENDLEWHAEMALEPDIAAHVMFAGMSEGWFRSDTHGRQTLGRYFDEDTDDPYAAREIINGDKAKVPNWSHGVSIGKLIVGYHEAFLAALDAAIIATAPEPATVTITIDAPPHITVDVVRK